MLNRLLQEFSASPNNSRQVLRLPDDSQLLLVHSKPMGPATLSLWRSRKHDPKSLKDFEMIARLTGEETDVPAGGPWGFGGTMTLHNKVLYVAWTGPHGVQLCSASVQGPELKWRTARTLLEGEYKLGDLFSLNNRLSLAWHRVNDHTQHTIGLSYLDRGIWNSQEVSQESPCFPPVADADAKGRIVLVWHTAAELLRTARLISPEHKPFIEQIGTGSQPAVCCLDQNQILVASEDDYGFVQSYLFDGKKWHSRNRLTILNPWLTSDQLHSPQLTCDRHGVVWMFFADNTRRCTFWTRWLGTDWSEVYNGPRVYYRSPRFDNNLLPIGRLSIEKKSLSALPAATQNRSLQKKETPDAEPGNAAIGMLCLCEQPLDYIEYRRQLVPDLNAANGKILFLDLLETARIEGLELQLQQAVKHSANPLLPLGQQGSFDEDRVFNHGSVIYDEGQYRMWYGGIREPRPGEPVKPWWDWIQCGYAESDDGINWKRVAIGLVEDNGNKQNNIVPNLRHVPLVIKDKNDPAAERRYKSFYFWNSGEHLEMARGEKYGRNYDPRQEWLYMDLFTSKDGVHLERVPGKVHFPGESAKPYSTIPQSVFRDDRETDAQKRYKAYGFMAMNVRRRGTCYLYSSDCINWTAHAELPVIDPAVRGTPPAVGGPTGQVHDTVCFPYECYYLALYQDQHDPLNMPVELAVSRDAENFHHVKPGHKVVPLGKPDDWDALTILPTMPVMLKEQILLYYGGSTEGKVDFRTKPLWVTKPGLATLRRDGFTAMALKKDVATGSLTTIPFRLPQLPSGIVVNANCAGGQIRASFIDARRDRPLSGYSLEDCPPLQGDHLAHQIVWTKQRKTPENSQHVRLKFELKRGKQTPQLYAFWFEAVT